MGKKIAGPLEVRSNAELGAFGRDDLMALAAVRYCLGRMTYIVSDCADWLVHQWPHISPSTRAIIQRDIEAEFERDDAARERGDAYLPLGMTMDRRTWERVRGLWAPNVADKRRAGGTSA